MREQFLYVMKILRTKLILDLIALVEGNPQLYAKGKAGYRNIQEKDMALVKP